MPTRLTLAALRRQAVVNSLQRATTLDRAIASAGFVQADPIRAPARAQDLILRHRVAGYRVGDLERRFTKLGLEEDFLYAYGFMPRETYRLLHPRAVTDRWGGTRTSSPRAFWILCASVDGPTPPISPSSSAATGQ